LELGGYLRKEEPGIFEKWYITVFCKNHLRK
jgi:hypothetical protein